MAKISSPNGEYPIATPASGDKVIGTDVSDGNATKNFQIGDIASFVAGTIPPAPVDSVTGSGPVVVTPTTGDVNVTLGTIVGVADDYFYANITVDQYGRVIAAGDEQRGKRQRVGGDGSKPWVSGVQGFQHPA